MKFYHIDLHNHHHNQHRTVPSSQRNSLVLLLKYSLPPTLTPDNQWSVLYHWSCVIWRMLIKMETEYVISWRWFSFSIMSLRSIQLFEYISSCFLSPPNYKINFKLLFLNINEKCPHSLEWENSSAKVKLRHHSLV